MGNCLMGFPNRVDAATLSNGSWISTLPLVNLQSRVINKVARSTNVNLSSTKLDMDLSVTRSTKLLCLRNHSISLAGLYRITASSVSNFATLIYDSGWSMVWPVVYPHGTLEWEDDNWWSGQYTPEQTQGYTTELDHILPSNILARYWRIEINDTTNAAGHIDIGRVFIGPAWSPQINIAYGAADGWETKTEVQEALAGSEYFQVRTPYRVVRISFDDMTEDEAFANAFEIQRRAGIDKEILWIHDVSDVAHSLRRRFLSRIRQLSPIEYPYYIHNKTAFELKELL